MLTDTAIRKAKLAAGAKRERLFDGGGLYLELAPTGGKWWRLKYRFAGKEKLLSLGVYPEVSLADARIKRDDARKLLRQGVDPSVQRKLEKTTRVDAATNTLEIVTREWFARFSPTWAPSYSRGVNRLFERHVFPWVGSRPIAEVTAPELLGVLRRIESKGRLETAHRARTDIGMVMRYAISTGRAERDPTADLRGALPPSLPVHMAAVTDPSKLGGLLRALWSYDEGTPVVAAALKLAPMLFVRPGELRSARWVDIDLDKGEWAFTASKTKTPHIVPLASQAVAILRELHPLTGSGQYVFPSARTSARPMSDAAVNAALRRMGVDNKTATGHGFRATARTLLDEVLRFRIELIEAQLAHAVRDPNGRAYNRTAHLDERRKMMQTWADYLDKLRSDLRGMPCETIGLNEAARSSSIRPGQVNAPDQRSAW
jgi:integrase